VPQPSRGTSADPAPPPAPAPPLPPSGAEGLVVARGLWKRYGDFEAVKGIDVTVRSGEAFGFLGPNGAGKSSTMRMIACVSPPTAGLLRVFGRDPLHDGPAVRARLGVVSQDDTLDQELSVRDNVVVYGRYFDLPWAEARRRCARLLEFVHLTDWAGAKVDTLSGGMKRRLTIARALVNEPELLLLDEPTTGLDPQARHAVWDRLYRLKQRGVTLILTTHYMDEAEQLCDRLVVLHQGVIAAEGSPRQLIDRYVTREVVELRFAPDDAERVGQGELDALLAHVAERVETLPDRVLLYTDDGDGTTARLGGVLPLHPESTLVRRSGLEDVFLRLTGRSLVE
jgi:lipooligosaccharide transport system ATP-binding protein